MAKQQLGRVAKGALALARTLNEDQIQRLVAWVDSPDIANPAVAAHELGTGERAAAALVTYLAEAVPELGARGSVALIEASRAVTLENQSDANQVEVVWTGPAVSGLPARHTASVLNELLTRSTYEVILVGYSFSAGFALILDTILDRARNGVAVWVVAADPEQLRPFARRMRNTVRVSTLVHTEPNETLHAKVTVVDRREMLVTSANFTDRGLRHNVEFGVLVRGRAAGEAALIIEHLARTGAIRDVAI